MQYAQREKAAQGKSLSRHLRDICLHVLALTVDVIHFVITIILGVAVLFTHLWVHLLIIAITVIAQAVYRGCPLTILSGHIRGLALDHRQSRLLRRGFTSALYDRYGLTAALILLSMWSVLISLNLLLKHWLMPSTIDNLRAGFYSILQTLI